ncbi:MAG: PKD domain-containing protein [Bacteroidetes bacterium]|nr:PKD domain-containing protein [Bacteroidota bacterium]
MKTKCLLLFTLFSLLCGAYAQSQITLTPADLPAFDQALESTQDTTLPAGIDLGTASAQAQSWDFTGLQGDETITNTVVMPSQTPNAEQFPTATFAFAGDDGSYRFVELGDEALLALGGSAPFPDGSVPTLAFDPPQQLLTVPATYGSTFSAPFRFDVTVDGSAFNVDSVRVLSNGTITGEIDAFGEITVPLGAFPALRQRVETISTDSVFVQIFGSLVLIEATQDTTVSYEWWGQDGVGSICDIEVATDGTPVSATYLNGFAPALVAPVASFTAEEQQPGQFQFSDASNYDPTSWSWDFGDGSSSDEQNPQHTYSVPGIYTVCLTASNTQGADEACQEITVVFAPQAGFAIEMLSDSSFQFNDLSANTPTSWEWDFGDGSSSDEQNPMHTYAASGDYTVCLTAANSAGSDTSCNAVEVVIVSAERLEVHPMRLAVFPSPARDIANLHFEAGNFSREAEVRVYNVLGQPMLIQRFSQLPQDYSFRVAGWQPGLYYVAVRIGGKRFVQPFSVH